MSVLRMRQFLLGLYHDLPNVLFVGSLVLGSITGYLPLVWVSMGLIINGLTVAAAQKLFGLLFDTTSKGFLASQFSMAKNSACEIINNGMPTGGASIVAPSYWLSSALFFSTFVIYNSIQVAMMPVVKGANQDKADIRHAFTLTTIVIGAVFFLLVLLRGYSGCETYLCGALGSLVGVGLGIGFWHLLNLCGAGMVPDVLQIVNSMAPPGSDNVPVVCAA